MPHIKNKVNDNDYDDDGDDEMNEKTFCLTESDLIAWFRCDIYDIKEKYILFLLGPEISRKKFAKVVDDMELCKQMKLLKVTRVTEKKNEK